MPRLTLFPFRWSAPAPGSVTTVAEVARWTRLTAATKAWTATVGGILPRFDRVHAQPKTAFGVPVPGNFHIQTEYPALIATGGNVVIQSNISETP